jgi:hypothetical protein
VLRACAAVVLVASTVGAEEREAKREPLHRLSLGAGLATAYFSRCRDGRCGGDEKGLQGSGSVGYGYYVAPKVELGAALTVMSGCKVCLLPAGSVRGRIPLRANSGVELGVNVRMGLFLALHTSGPSVGLGMSLGPDVRVWVSDHFGMQISGEGTLGGSKSTDAGDSNDGAVLLALGGSLAAVWRD